MATLTYSAIHEQKGTIQLFGTVTEVKPKKWQFTQAAANS